MIKKVLAVMILVISLNLSVVHAEETRHIEIFDPVQDRVVKVVDLNTEIHNMTLKWIKDIDGIYGKSDPITDDGYAIRIPVDPAVKVEGKWLNALVKEVYLIIPKANEPFLLIFEDESKITCFPFKGDINQVSRVLGFKLKDK